MHLYAWSTHKAEEIPNLPDPRILPAMKKARGGLDWGPGGVRGNPYELLHANWEIMWRYLAPGLLPPYFEGILSRNIEPRPKELRESGWSLSSVAEKAKRAEQKGNKITRQKYEPNATLSGMQGSLWCRAKKVSADNYFDYIIKPASANAGTDLVVFENCEETGKPIAVLIECRYSYSGSEGSLSQSDVDDKVKLLEERWAPFLQR